MDYTESYREMIATCKIFNTMTVLHKSRTGNLKVVGVIYKIYSLINNSLMYYTELNSDLTKEERKDLKVNGFTLDASNMSIEIPKAILHRCPSKNDANIKSILSKNGMQYYDEFDLCSKLSIMYHNIMLVNEITLNKLLDKVS